MVLFGRKRQSDRRELLASMNQMAVGKPVDNGELTKWLLFLLLFQISCLRREHYQLVSKKRLIFKQANAVWRKVCN
jgi:hypothetical protein